jgi:hypothetical protein
MERQHSKSVVERADSLDRSQLDYVPLLAKQRDLHAFPRGKERFESYLSMMLNEGRDDVALAPLVAANPMAKEHVATVLDHLLAMDADGIAKHMAEEAWSRLGITSSFKASLIVADDLMGRWTNRFAAEHALRFENGPHQKRFWITGILWSSETPLEQTVRETILAAIYRTDWILLHGPAVTLREKLIQEGHALAAAGCTEPFLDNDDVEYTREVLEPFLEAKDMRTAVECLFGDAAGQTLGFTPRGLSPMAGLAMAVHDVRQR